MTDRKTWEETSPERQATVDAVERLRLRGGYGDPANSDVDSVVAAAGQLVDVTEDDIRRKYPELVPEYAEIDVRERWLALIEACLSHIVQLYGETEPSIRLYAAYELGGLVIDLDDRPWTGNQDPDLKTRVRDLVLSIRTRTRDA